MLQNVRKGKSNLIKEWRDFLNFASRYEIKNLITFSMKPQSDVDVIALAFYYVIIIELKNIDQLPKSNGYKQNYII